MKRIGLAITLFALVATAQKGKWKAKDDQKDKKKGEKTEKSEKGWKSARDHWNPNQVQHDTEAGMALIGNTKIMLPGAVRREAAKEAAKRNNAQMEQCKTAVCKMDCKDDDKSVGCKYCVLKTCLKRTPKAGTCAKNKCSDSFSTKRKWIACMFENCESKDGKKQAGPLSARSFGDVAGVVADAVVENMVGKWDGKGKGGKRNRSENDKNTYAGTKGKGGKAKQGPKKGGKGKGEWMGKGDTDDDTEGKGGKGKQGPKKGGKGKGEWMGMGGKGR